ncbi:hypothetical protein NUSPORA_00116 [Nucleospora cyclopteri]
MKITRQNYKELIKSYIERNDLKAVDFQEFFAKLENGLAADMTPAEMADYCSGIAASMITVHPQYDRLASAILMSFHHSVTSNSFSEKISIIQAKKGILNKEIVEMIKVNAKTYDSLLKYERDFDLNYFGMVSMLKSYLIKVNQEVVERPQDVFMRVAIQIHKENFQKVAETYELLSLMYYTHGTPTLYNACFEKSQLASCFLLAVKDDTILGIFDTLKEMAILSKYSGGIGVHMSNLRSDKSQLITTGGFSKGIIPVIKMMNDAMKYINQGGARRCSTAAFYLEVWHKDIFAFLDLRKNTGPEELRAREAFTALFINDLFMERVENNEEWSLFDPNIAKGLIDVWGKDFNKLYRHYEKTKSRLIVPAQKLWKEIICAQIETGTPYMVYKDACNKNSNQKNLGTIKSSNLCAEVIEHSDPEQTAVCNLASICLPKFVSYTKGTGQPFFDFNKLKFIAGKVLENLNAVVDSSLYPVESADRSNRATRAVGMGVQGLADLFIKMRLPFESDEARKLNSMIFETMNYACLEMSCEIAMRDGCYPTFNGSPLSQGIFHHEMFTDKKVTCGLWDWELLRAKIKKYGVRNSLCMCCMPTASTSQICGNSECIEPITSNIYTRRTFAGEFQIVNTSLMMDLIKLGLWNNEMRQLLIECDGSIQNIPVIPNEIKDLYKTVWEIKMKRVIDLSADRQAFIDQSQSLNIFIAQPTYSMLSSMHFYGWKKGLKTGMYYLRTCPVAQAIKFTVNQELIKKTLDSMQSITSENRDNQNEGPNCEGCSC